MFVVSRQHLHHNFCRRLWNLCQDGSTYRQTHCGFGIIHQSLACYYIYQQTRDPILLLLWAKWLASLTTQSYRMVLLSRWLFAIYRVVWQRELLLRKHQICNSTIFAMLTLQVFSRRILMHHYLQRSQEVLTLLNYQDVLSFGNLSWCPPSV